VPDASGLHLPRQNSRRGASNIKDAITGYLASLKKHDEPAPLPITEEVVELPA